MRCPMARRKPQRAADRMVAAVVQGPSPASAKGPPVKFLAPNRTVTPQTQKGLQDLRARPLSWRGRCPIVPFPGQTSPATGTASGSPINVLIDLGWNVIACSRSPLPAFFPTLVIDLPMN